MFPIVMRQPFADRVALRRKDVESKPVLDLATLTDSQQRALNRYASAKRHRTESNTEALRAATIHVIACGLKVPDADEFARAEAEFYTAQDPFAEVE